MDKKGIAKNVSLFKTKVFFWSKKLKRQKKTGDAKVYKKSSKNHHNQKEGKTEQETCALPPKKEKQQNKENRGKNGEKMKIEKIEEEDTNQDRETRREREKEIHKRGVKKEARELCKKKCKKKEWTHFSKIEKTFSHTKRFQLKIKAEENICFFKKKGKVKKMRRNKTADETWELIEEEGEWSESKKRKTGRRRKHQGIFISLRKKKREDEQHRFFFQKKKETVKTETSFVFSLKKVCE